MPTERRAVGTRENWRAKRVSGGPAALRWAAAFAAKYSYVLGRYKQPVISISVNLLDALSEQQRDRRIGWVPTARGQSFDLVDGAERLPHHERHPATHGAESTNHSQNSPRATRNVGYRVRVMANYGTENGPVLKCSQVLAGDLAWP